MDWVWMIRSSIAKNDSVERMIEIFGIDVYLGEGKFSSKNSLTVNDKQLNFEYACIATGSHPKKVEIEGLNEIPYFTSDNVFNLTEQPKNMLIFWAGTTGCELG